MRFFIPLAFGPVLRVQSNLLVAPHRDGLYASNEWQALQHSNGLLSMYAYLRLTILINIRLRDV